MNNSFKESVDRAIKLLETPTNYEDYIVLKIKPVVRSCFCFHCLPQTWAEVNRFISPCGPLEDEGDVLIDRENTKFVLQCHEGGPEIVMYLGLVTASILFVKSIIELVTVLLKGAEKEKKKGKTDFRMIYYRQTKNGIEENELLDITLPLEDRTIKNLYKKIKSVIRKKKSN